MNHDFGLKGGGRGGEEREGRGGGLERGGEEMGGSVVLLF